MTRKRWSELSGRQQAAIIAAAVVQEALAFATLWDLQIADAVAEGLTEHLPVEQVEGGLVSTGIGLREWLGTLPKGSSDVAVAAFDTGISKPRLPGSAAAAAEKRLRRPGFRVLARSQSFFVEGTTGPLLRGERERARRWGEELAIGLAAPRPSHGQVT
jgi:hypothetical protein